MNLTFHYTLTSSFRDLYLLSYSILLPASLYIGLGYYFQSDGYQTQLLAGVMGVSILFWAMVTNAFTVFQQRDQGVFKLLRITPFKASSFIMSTISAWICISLLISFLLLLVGFFTFRVHLGILPVVCVMMFVILGTLLYSFIGFIIAYMSDNVNHVSMFSNLLSLPSILLSEAFFSLENAPNWVQFLSTFNPFAYLIKGMHLSLLSAYSEAMFYLVLLFCVSSFFLLILLWLFKRRTAL